MAILISPKRGEKAIDEEGFLTRRFLGYLEANTDASTDNTKAIAINIDNIAANTTDLIDHKAASDPHPTYYLADGTRAISGDLEHTGANIGFYGVAVTVRPPAYTQTYSAASRTHDNLNSATLTDNTGGTADTTLVAISGSGDDATLNDNFADLTAQINALRTDLANVKAVLNQVIDDDQLQGLKQ